MHSIRQIQVVKALAEHRHFGRAARALGVTQPNLTRSLKHMEEVLGVPLFDRQGVTLTPYGEIVLRHGERAIADFRELSREIRLVKGLDVGELRVAVGPYPADISAARAIGALLRDHPMLFVEMRNVNWRRAIEQVATGAVDLALAEIDGASDPELLIEPIRNSRMSFFASANHPLANREALVLDELLEFPWAGPTLPHRMRALLPRVEKTFALVANDGADLHPRALVGSFCAMKEIVLGGLAISAAIPSQIARELADGALVLLPAEAPWLTLNYGFVSKRNRMLSPAAQAYMEIVRAIEQAIPR